MMTTNYEVIEQELIDNAVSSLKHRGMDSTDNIVADMKKSGLPTKKWEHWQYTNIVEAISSSFDWQIDSYKQNLGLKELSKYQIVIKDGAYSPDESVIPTGLELTFIPDKETTILQTNDPFLKLNNYTAHATLVLNIPDNYICDDIIIVQYKNTTSETKINANRFSVVAGKNSELAILEVNDAQTYQFNNNNSKIELGQNAKVEYILANLCISGATSINRLDALLERDAVLNSFTFTTGGDTTRNDIYVKLQDEGAHADINGLYALRGTQHSDNFSLIEHCKSNTTSHQLFKGILDEDSFGIFNGKIVVAKDAQQVDSAQLNKNLLLSSKARANTRPQLEVYADDVKCAHGATIGQMSEDELFYLESRGIPKEKAYKVLCHAFAEDALDTIKNQKAKNYLSAWLKDNFEKNAEHVGVATLGGNN